MVKIKDLIGELEIFDPEGEVSIEMETKSGRTRNFRDFGLIGVLSKGGNDRARLVVRYSDPCLER